MGRRDIFLAGVQHLGDLVLAIHRYQSIAQVVGRRVQRDRQADLERLLREVADPRREAGGEMVTGGRRGQSRPAR